MPPIARLTREVRAGVVGRVRMVHLREHRFPFLPKVGDWNRFSRNTGGTLVEKCCHFFDLMAHIVGERPERVVASGAQDVNHLDERYDGEVPDILDNAYVIVEFPGGARGLLDLCMFAEGSVHQEEVVVVGDVGKVEAFLPDSTLRTGRRADGRDGVTTETVHDPRVRHEGFHHGSSYLEHLDFLAAVRGGARPTVGLDDGLWSVAAGVAAHRSIDEGRPVPLAEVLGED
jgi:predicted dehydrogenase